MNSEVKNIIIVGGSSGLGKVVAKAYANAGCRVLIISRKRPKFIDESELFFHFELDLAKIDSDKANLLALRVVEQIGKPSYVIFCQRYRGEDRNFSNELFVSLTATEILIEALVPHFLNHGDRAIVTVSSVYADFVGSSQPLSYHVVKAGLNALVRFYAANLGRKGIRTNAIAPLTYLKEESKKYYLESVETMDKYRKLVPLSRMPTAEECADVITFLGSDKASFVNGQIIYVDGGVSVVWPEEFA